MKRILFFLFLGVGLLTVQTAVLRFFPIQRIRPDLMVIYTLCLGFSAPPILGGILSLFMGYYVDLFSGNTLGLYTLTRPLVFYGAYLFKSKVYLEGYPSQSVFVFLVVFLEGSLVLILFALLRSQPLSALIHSSCLYSFLPQVAFTAGITPLFFSLSRKWGGLPALKNGTAPRSGGKDGRA